MRCLITQFIVALIVYYRGALMPVVCLLSYFSRYHGNVPDLLQRVLYFLPANIKNICIKERTSYVKLM